MKKYLPYADYLAAGTGVLGALLHKWMRSAGADQQGLYPAVHPGWIGYLVVMAAALVVIYLMSRECSENPTWQANFPGGLLPLLGHVAAAVGAVFYALPLLQGASIQMVAGISGLCSAAALLTIAAQQFLKKRPMGMLYLLPCLFFALQLFLLGRQYNAETQLQLFIPQVLAAAASCLSCYQLAGFGADFGCRRKSLFWSLSAATLCLAAVPGGHWSLVCLGVWHLLSHCTLTTPTEEQPAEEPAEETAE